MFHSLPHKDGTTAYPTITTFTLLWAANVFYFQDAGARGESARFIHYQQWFTTAITIPWKTNALTRSDIRHGQIANVDGLDGVTVVAGRVPREVAMRRVGRAGGVAALPARAAVVAEARTITAEERTHRLQSN